MPPIELTLLDGTYTIHRLPPDANIPAEALQSAFCSITRTPDELSIVCPSSVTITGTDRSDGWSCLQLLGPLDLNAIGILSELTAVLSNAHISIFALSTYNTDYLLVRSPHIDTAVTALQAAGYRFR